MSNVPEPGGGGEGDVRDPATVPVPAPAPARVSPPAPVAVVRPYRDPLVLEPLFRDEEHEPRTLEQPVLGSGPPPGPSRGQAAPGRGPRPAEPEAPSRPAGGGRPLRVVLDPGLAERPARVCSGWWALTVLVAAAATAAWLARTRELPTRTAPESWPTAAVAGCLLAAFLAVAGLRCGRAGQARVQVLFGRYRGTVRRTGLLWSSPFPRHLRADVRLRHWRSEPLSVVDAEGTALHAVVLVVWRVKDTARALLAVDDHLAYLREQVESSAARVFSRMPADPFDEALPEPAGSLRDAEAVGDALTRVLAAECRAVGIEVFSVRPLQVAYAPEVAGAMQRRRVAAIDARHRDSVLTSVIDAVDDAVHRMTDRGLVGLDDYERKALVKDLTVAFYTSRGSAADLGR
ncbi:SPFH domain-containing protein [Streptomyces sp. NPDC058734]|uniref:SPFH domain-containing protein n=1 Tax=Streptomyces sp. NPDC058734 TaxID=3346615 RepID=UPI0036C7C901